MGCWTVWVDKGMEEVRSDPALRFPLWAKPTERDLFFHATVPASWDLLKSRARGLRGPQLLGIGAFRCKFDAHVPKPQSP